MTKYLLVYTGGVTTESEAAQEEVMAAWLGWFEKLGAAVVDAGEPFSMQVRSISSDGAVSEGPVGVMATGYSVLEADSLDAAVEMAKDCPHIDSGGQVTVYETFPIM